MDSPSAAGVRQRLRLVALSAIAAMIVIVCAMQWRHAQIRTRETVARALVKNYLGVPDLDDHSLQVRVLSFIRGDMLVEWQKPNVFEGTLSPREETAPRKTLLRWTVNGLTQQVYRWQSRQLEKQTGPNEINRQGPSNK